MKRHAKLARLLLTRRLVINDPNFDQAARRARHERWRIALAILAVYALVIWYIAQGDRPVPIAPRSYHCGVEEVCSGLRLVEAL
ncbi:MAG: hypothetical protein JWO52_4104 [Gammaproteobacteria bacterium]|nr:hypothetical protein [Gammaproteobacteria bacterium]